MVILGGWGASYELGTPVIERPGKLARRRREGLLNSSDSRGLLVQEAVSVFQLKDTEVLQKHGKFLLEQRGYRGTSLIRNCLPP